MDSPFSNLEEYMKDIEGMMEEFIAVVPISIADELIPILRILESKGLLDETIQAIHAISPPSFEPSETFLLLPALKEMSLSNNESLIDSVGRLISQREEQKTRALAMVRAIAAKDVPLTTRLFNDERDPEVVQLVMEAIGSYLEAQDMFLDLDNNLPASAKIIN